MRPRDRGDREDLEAAPPSEPSPAPRPSARAGGVGLSSMVVRPSPVQSEDEGGDSEPSDDDVRNNRREDSPDLPHHRLWDRPQSPRRRGGSSPDYRRRRRDPPPPLRHGRSPPSPGFHHRYQRFHYGSGYSQHTGSASPCQQKPDILCHEPNFDNFIRPHFGRGSRGGRGGRFQDVSPNHRHGRGGRSSGRGYGVSGQGAQPFHGEYIHRNDPNLSPREGDWICQKPSCGNLNFARRTHCNNCNMYRYGSDLDGPAPAQSPRGGYFDSSPVRGSPSRIFGPPIDRGPRRNMDRYKSPRGWEFDHPRDFRPHSPSQGHVGRFSDNMRRNFHDETEYRAQDRSVWSESQWDGKVSAQHRFISERNYGRRKPSPGVQWIPRQRSRSPLAERPLKGSYISKGRGDRPFDSYLDHGRGDDLSVSRGRGYQQRDSFGGRGRGDRRGQGLW